MNKTLFNLLLKPQQIIGLSVVFSLSGCTLTNFHSNSLSDMQSLALCRSGEQAQQAEKRVTAEYGFRRFAKNTYRPILEQCLFGHEIRVIELGEQRNKLYVAGNPREFGHHFRLLLKEVNCDEKSCQALLPDNQTLHIYKVGLKKAKDTTVIECTKPKTTEIDD